MGRRRGALPEEDDDDEPPPPKKARKKKTPPPPLHGLTGLPPRQWARHELLPFARALLPPDDSLPPAATAAARRRLGVRVPQLRATPCAFWADGRCARGASCSFAHADGTRGETCPPPLDGLGHPGLPRCVGRAMLHLGYREPSPVQAQAWPAALAGLSLICRAPTGSGKTLAYLLPAIAHALAASPPLAPAAGPAALVLVPTRELAIQVCGVCRSLQRVCGVRTEALYGGDPREEQCEAMEGVVPLLVATAGRLIDMLRTKHVKLGRVTMLVLDEADSLVSLGFSEQVLQICGQLRPDRQTLLFSATLSERLEAAASEWIKDPVRIYVERAMMETTPAGGEDDDFLSLPPASVSQRFVLCGGAGLSKRAALLQELRRLGSVPVDTSQHTASAPPAPRERNLSKALVFVNQIKHMKELALSLRKAGGRCEVLHGERSQREREAALASFRNGQAPVLICSDVAARGIDVPRLPVVVNFDPPATLAQYTHRLGRTGRQGAPGTVISLLKADGPSRAFAAEVRRLFVRVDEPLPDAIRNLLDDGTSVGEAEGSASSLAVQPVQLKGSLLDFAATFAA